MERVEALEMADLGLRYPDLGAVGYDRTTIALFERLVEQPCMDKAWVTLSKAFDDTKQVPDTCQFADACNQIFKTWSTSAIRTREEHGRHFHSLARDLMSIANKLAFEPEFGALGRVAASLSVVDMLADDEIKDFGNAFISDAGGDGDVNADIARRCLRDLIPGFHAHARSLAAHAIKVAGELPVSRQAGRATAGRIFFKQNLSAWLEGHLGERIRGQDGVVGNVASALFPQFEAVSDDSVRKARTRAGARRKV